MLLITRKLINRLSEPYKEADMLACYVTSQAISSTTSRAILLINHDVLKILFLNVFSSKVVQMVRIPLSDLEQQRLKSGVSLASIWSFQSHGIHYRFSIIKKMLTLGSMQAEFLTFVEEHVVRA